MYGIERKAMENVDIRGFTNQNPDMQGGNILHMIDEQGIEEMGKKLTDKIFGFFTFFGNISAGFIGFMIIFRIVKWILDSIIHGRALYDLYGMSIYLLGSFWDSVTLCLLTRRTEQPTKEDAELKEIETEKMISAPSAPSTSNPQPESVEINIKDTSVIHTPRIYPHLY